MIAAWMIFATEVGALLFFAAWFAEWALRSTRRPIRGVWVGALIGTNVFPILAAIFPFRSESGSRWAMHVGRESMLASLHTPLVVVWSVAFALGLFVLLSAVWRMSRTRPSWKTEHMDNAPVLVSHDIGPALVGVLQYSIVVPQWTYQLESQARTLLVSHEREHARKYDPMLLTIAVVAVVLAPWNVFNWLLMKRLHLAVELDCDQRVLRAHPDARGYGALLLDVAERVLPSVMPAAAFVEHGASLETRIDAISSGKKTVRTFRVASGLALSLLLVAAACITPRPVVIVVQPAAAPVVERTDVPVAPTADAPSRLELQRRELNSRLSALEQAPASKGSSAASMDSITRELQRALVVEQQKLRTSVAEYMRNEDELRPRAPSAHTEALDEAENLRMRNIVRRVAPRTLAAWPRADSALFLLFDVNGDVVKQVTAPKQNLRSDSDPMHDFGSVFTMPDINGIDSASEFTIERGAQGEVLPAPLTLFTAHVADGVPTPRTREEITPSRETMLAAVRARQPESLSDTLEGANVSLLLYNTKGQLLKSATVALENSARVTEPAYKALFEEKLWKRAFGAVMDSGTVMKSGTVSFLDGRPLHVGPAKLMYVVLSQRSEFEAYQVLIENQRHNWSFGMSSVRRPYSGGVLDYDALMARLRVLVHTRVPDAYGDWARGDSAVIFLLDANNELVARKAGPIPKSWSFNMLADYISLRVLTVSADDIDRAGTTNRVTSESGRVLDKPLVVIWGRLTAEATRKRKLAEMK